MAIESLSFLGAGAMGEALMRGLIGAQVLEPAQISAYDPATARLHELAGRLSIRALDRAPDVGEAQVILLAVKPQVLASALEPLRELSTSHTVLSIAAGVGTSAIESCFAREVPVVRVMPNTPALVNRAASAIAPGRFAREEHLAIAREIFGAVGVVVDAAEKDLDAVTGLSGSGPAFVYAFIEALADGGVRAGLSRDVALKLAAQTVMGSAEMVLETGKHPGELKDMVASPGGTTIAGLHALEQRAFRGAVMDAVVAAANRSRELGGK